MSSKETKPAHKKKKEYKNNNNYKPRTYNNVKHYKDHL